MKVKILSWNIWVDCHFDELKKFISESNADVVGLQEVRENDDTRDVIGFMESLGYQSVFAAKQIWRTPHFMFGPALFSKFEIVSNAIHVLSEKDERYAVQADIRVGERTLHAFSTHLIHTHQQTSEVQDSQAKNLLKVVPKEKSIVMGDFNATPKSNAIKMMKQTLTDTDINSIPTWSVYAEGCPVCKLEKVDTRLDYIFVSNDLRSDSFEVGQSKASDHLPISVSVEI